MERNKKINSWPKLYEYVLEAVSVLSDIKGSSAKSIINLIRNEFMQNDERFRGGNITMNIRYALKYGLEHGELVHRAGRYKLRKLNLKTKQINHISVLNNDISNELLVQPNIPSISNKKNRRQSKLKIINSNVHKYETRSQKKKNLLNTQHIPEDQRKNILENKLNNIDYKEIKQDNSKQSKNNNNKERRLEKGKKKH